MTSCGCHTRADAKPRLYSAIIGARRTNEKTPACATLRRRGIHGRVRLPNASRHKNEKPLDLNKAKLSR